MSEWRVCVWEPKWSLCVCSFLLTTQQGLTSLLCSFLQVSLQTSPPPAQNCTGVTGLKRKITFLIHTPSFHFTCLLLPCTFSRQYFPLQRALLGPPLSQDSEWDPCFPFSLFLPFVSGRMLCFCKVGHQERFRSFVSQTLCVSCCLYVSLFVYPSIFVFLCLNVAVFKYVSVTLCASVGMFQLLGVLSSLCPSVFFSPQCLNVPVCLDFSLCSSGYVT